MTTTLVTSRGAKRPIGTDASKTVVVSARPKDVGGSNGNSAVGTPVANKKRIPSRVSAGAVSSKPAVVVRGRGGRK